tara:strand:- start:2438 stop:2632 length:195 start_codon:yes stop_codon:yes gene_type:complete
MEHQNRIKLYNFDDYFCDRICPKANDLSINIEAEIISFHGVRPLAEEMIKIIDGNSQGNCCQSY